MPCFEFKTPEEKKIALLQVIDDMTAAAIDRSSQGYSQFLQYRNDLIALIDSYAKEDESRTEFAKCVSSKLDEFFPTK